MNILITGGSGFIGVPVINKLISSGNNKVLALSRSMRYSHPEILEQLTWINSSLLLDDVLLEQISAFAPEVIINLAWEKIPDFSYEASLQNLQNQVEFFRRILSIPCVKKVVTTGSCWEYGKNIGVCKESDDFISKNYFTWAKNSLRDFVQFECIKKNINFVWARIFYVYGPNQRSNSLIPSLIADLRARIVPVINSPSNANDFIYIDDVAEVIVKMCTARIDSGIYNIGAGESIELIKILSIIEKEILGSDMFTKMYTEKNLKNIVQDTNFWGDLSKTTKALNWSPVTSIEDGIKKMIAINKI